MSRSVVWAGGEIRIFAILLIVSTVGWAQTTESRALGRVQSAELNEISGMAVSRQNRGIIWVHDDGAIRDVYAMKTSGEVVSRVRLPDKLTDVEDLALGPGPDPGSDYLYVGDIGDNDGKRESVRLVRFPEPDLSGDVDRRIKMDNVEEFRLVYPHGPIDAETLLLDTVTGDVVIVTKHKSETIVFVVRPADLAPGKLIRLSELCRLPVAKVSAGDLSRDGRRVILRREEIGWFWPRLGSERLANALRRPPQRIIVRGEKQSANGEAIAFHPSGDAYLTVSEGEREWIYAFRLK